MIKITFCLRRLPSLTQAQFLDYWHRNHAPLVQSHAAALRIRRYIQLVPIETELSAPMQKARGAPPAYDGVAELWFDSLEALAENGRRPEVQAAGALLLEDERRFIDLPKSPLWWGQERVVVG